MSTKDNHNNTPAKRGRKKNPVLNKSVSRKAKRSDECIPNELEIYRQDDMFESDTDDSVDADIDESIDEDSNESIDEDSNESDDDTDESDDDDTDESDDDDTDESDDDADDIESNNGIIEQKIDPVNQINNPNIETIRACTHDADFSKGVFVGSFGTIVVVLCFVFAYKRT